MGGESYNARNRSGHRAPGTFPVFEKSYMPPPDMSFAKSDALFPAGELSTAITPGFEAQCQVLCFGSFLSCDEVQARFEDIREML